LSLPTGDRNRVIFPVLLGFSWIGAIQERGNLTKISSGFSVIRRFGASAAARHRPR
jgi:hypothetical protein